MCAKIYKISIVIKSVIMSEDTMMHKAVRPSNYFSNTFIHNQAEQIKKRVFCAQYFRNTADLNTVEAISKLNNFITYLSWSRLIIVGVM